MNISTKFEALQIGRSATELRRFFSVNSCVMLWRWPLTFKPWRFIVYHADLWHGIIRRRGLELPQNLPKLPLLGLKWSQIVPFVGIFKIWDIPGILSDFPVWFNVFFLLLLACSRENRSLNRQIFQHVGVAGTKNRRRQNVRSRRSPRERSRTAPYWAATRRADESALCRSHRAHSARTVPSSDTRSEPSKTHLLIVRGRT